MVLPAKKVFTFKVKKPKSKIAPKVVGGLPAKRATKLPQKKGGMKSITAVKQSIARTMGYPQGKPGSNKNNYPNS
jgi:hypothetical protein